MRNLWPLLVLVFGIVACESPVEPSTVGDDDRNQDQTQIVIINIGGDDDHSGTDDDGGDPVENRAPQVRNPGTQNTVAGESVVLIISAFDPDGDPLTCSLDGAPRGVAIDPDTCIITGAVTPSSADDSPFVATVSASDGKALDAAQFIWNVTAPVEPEG